jgi:D-cysteine desulfhydrase
VFPRVALADLPTPLEHLPRLSADLGREIFIKRDDCIGPALGGNKARKLEYLIGDALARHARKVVTFGGLQSNHARMTAAACCRFGLEPHLFYFERRPARFEGNLALNAVLGAKMHFIPFGSSGEAAMTLEQTNLLVRLIATVRLGAHYFIPVGGHNWQGCMGYVRAGLEIDQQARQMGLDKAWVVLAAGTGGTLAGLLAGLALIPSPLRLLGIDVGKLWKLFPASIARLARELTSRLGQPCDFTPQEVPLIEKRYVGQCYGVPSAEGNAAIRAGQLEGIVLDPIYTGKAFAGMLDLIERGEMGRSEPIIFLHTGGLPGLFAFAEALCNG